VFVADPKIADIQVKSPHLVYVFGKKPGQTTLFAVGARENVLANVSVTVLHNLTQLRGAIRRLHPKGEIQVESVDGSVVIDGLVPTVSMADDIRRLALNFVDKPEHLINRLGITAPNQVNLRVRVAEVSRDVEKQLGFNWTAVGAIGSFSLGLATVNPFVVNTVTHALAGSVSKSGWDFNVLVDALEGEGLLSILAEPNLTAISGETASFLAGGEFPVLIPEGDNRVVVEFKKFGVSLTFTPNVIGQSRINLHVRPEVSQLSTEGAVSVPLAGGTLTIPSLTTRRAETTVELASGQSFAIAGLLQNNISHDISKFPGLADVPVLGGLFKSDRFQRNESELVIIVTPYIVRPASNKKLVSPNDGMVPPHDSERFFVGGTYRRNPKTGTPVNVDRHGKTLIGPVGFQID
jgi:pilus assembly protein CpaC